MKTHAAIVIKDDANRILFIKRSETKKTLPGAWSFPSGTKEENEDINQTAVREAKEELGVTVEIIKSLAEVELYEFDVGLNFLLCRITEGEPKIADSSEFTEIRWMAFEEFFNEFPDDKIGHGLIWLRQHPEVWQSLKNEPGT